VEGAYTRARGRVRRMLLAGIVAVGAQLRHSWKAAPMLAVPAVAVLLLPAMGPPARTPAIPASIAATNNRSLPPPGPAPIRRGLSLGTGQNARRQAPTPRAKKNEITARPSLTTPHAASYDNDRTFTESLTDCLREGVQVNPGTVGCAPR
jgi:hypothetical protein